MTQDRQNPDDQSSKSESQKAGARRPCPICGKPATATATPFCSKRCADVDLHRWLGGAYAVPSSESDDALLPDEE